MSSSCSLSVRSGLTEGDVADLCRRITGKEHPTLKGELSDDYKAFLRANGRYRRPFDPDVVLFQGEPARVQLDRLIDGSERQRQHAALAFGKANELHESK